MLSSSEGVNYSFVVLKYLMKTREHLPWDAKIQKSSHPRFLVNIMRPYSRALTQSNANLVKVHATALMVGPSFWSPPGGGGTDMALTAFNPVERQMKYGKKWDGYPYFNT